MIVVEDDDDASVASLAAEEVDEDKDADSVFKAGAASFTSLPTSSAVPMVYVFEDSNLSFHKHGVVFLQKKLKK